MELIYDKIVKNIRSSKCLSFIHKIMYSQKNKKIDVIENKPKIDYVKLLDKMDIGLIY